MEDFKKKVAAHNEHVKRVGEHCATEETTKQALILPLLDILGFSPYDPTRVKAEYAADFPGAKSGERVDYALFSNGVPVMLIEAKSYGADLTNHCPQLSRYYNATPEVSVGAITNGREWRFFTDLVNKNIMDAEPFLRVRFDDQSQDASRQLAQFHHDRFQPEALRALAEENVYLGSFKVAITAMLRECDTDFVRYVAGRANIQRTMTSRFLDTIQPIVKQALANAISDVVTSSLAPSAPDDPGSAVVQPDPDAPQVDPANSKIITLANERRMVEVCQELLPGEDIQGKDTESYFSVLYQGKSNRWILRYWADKKRPTIMLGVPLTDAYRAEIGRARLTLTSGDAIELERPEHLQRIAGLLGDVLTYCKNDDNFRRGAGAN